MNELILQEMNKEYIIYLYQPEGKGEYGEIMYSFSDDKISVLKRAEEDDNGYYAYKAENKVRQVIDKKNLPLKCIQAWY